MFCLGISQYLHTLERILYVYLFIEDIYTGWAGYKQAVFYPGAQWTKYVYN